MRMTSCFLGVLVGLVGTSIFAASPDGLEWTQADSGTDKNLYGVSAAGSEFAVAAGEERTLLLWKDNQWQPFPDWDVFSETNRGWNSAGKLRGVEAVSDQEVWVTSNEWNDGHVAEWDGTSWNFVEDAERSWEPKAIWSIWTNGDSFILGRMNSLLTRRTRSGEFITQSLGKSDSVGLGDNLLRSISGGENGEVWVAAEAATGTGVRFLHSSDGGAKWEVLDHAPGADKERGGAVYALGTSEVWVAFGGKVAFWNGGEFTLEATLSDGDAVRAIFAKDATRVWAVGDNGLAQYFNGTNWQPLNLGSENLHSISGAGDTLWVVGDKGIIFKGVHNKAAGEN